MRAWERGDGWAAAGNFALAVAVYPAANQVGATPIIAHDYMMREYTAREESIVYMYVSNESPTLVDVYFDDVTMTYTPSNILQYNEYYPFQNPTQNSWTRVSAVKNNFLGNGGTELNTNSQLYDLEYRAYDPILGRMNGVDPMASKYSSLSPYNFSFNSPVMFNDPSGADPPQTVNGSATTSPYYIMYTYDDRIDPTELGAQTICSQCWREGNAGAMAFYGAAMGYGSGGFSNGFNQWVNSRIQARDVVRGIATALRSDFGGNVNPINGNVRLFSYQEARNTGGRYVNDHGAWSTISGGKSGFLDRIQPEGTVRRGSIFVDATLAADYDDAVSYLQQSSRAAGLIDYLQENAVGMEVWDVGNKELQYKDGLGILAWSSKIGMRMNDGSFHSPSLLLVHELNHAYLDVTGQASSQDYTWRRAKWGNGNEKNSTVQSNLVARQVNQGIRSSYSYDGRSVFMNGVNQFSNPGNTIQYINYTTRALNQYQIKTFNALWPGNSYYRP